MFRTAEEIRAQAIQLLDGRGSGIRTEAGEPVVDLVDAFSIESARLNVVAQYLEDINSLAGWRTIADNENRKIELADAFGVSSVTLNEDLARRLGAPTDLATDIDAVIYIDLNRFATSYARPRSAGQYATGVLTLFLKTPDPFTMKRGVAVQTGGDTGVVYDTTSDLIGVTPGFNSARNAYYVNVGVKARSVGRVANQIIGAVNQLLTPVPNVTSVTNESAVEGGLNRETDSALLDALSGVMAGTDINTKQGIKNFLLQQAAVVDALIVGPGHTLMTRATAGAVDVYIIGVDLQTDVIVVEVVVEEEAVVLPYKPVTQINSVVGAVPYSDGGGYLTPANDTTNVFYGSAADGSSDFTWMASPIGPSAAELVTVNFTHNELIRRLQRIFDEDAERNVPGSSIVVKQALRVGVSVQLKVVPLPGTTQVVAEGAAADALQAYFDSLVLDQLVEYSDAITVVTTVKIQGQFVIDRVDGFVIGKTGDFLSVANVPIVENEYARLDTVIFV